MNDLPDHHFDTATTTDVPRLEELVQLAYRGGQASVDWKNEHDLVSGPRITTEELHELIGNPAASILIIKEPSHRIVGCALVEKHSQQEVHIGMLAVDPSCQNLGLGRKLIAAAEDHACVHFGCTQATMFVLSGREALFAWYLRAGYEDTGKTVPFHGIANSNVPTNTDAHFRIISKSLVQSVPQFVQPLEVLR